ncbi:virulence protein VirJ [Novosphingobium sp. PhB57]|uniref:AcvB/VirJ family lysyl-phosphatidylglycerol hydrolase n=1 Tax=Novosphingobium sp. PhB57 TaxID=2485107 RepID=UPI0010497AA6|nr:AcvB/VirJ family lysyl-phosphatidylglycerol hydrolase [Novosphingobium sp. PhB57]TCU54782.1 virulence protein VirJ [Novosphingobium sp. PhB57]
MRGTAPRRSRRRAAWLAAVVIVAAAVLAAWLGWLGAWNASPFADLPAASAGTVKGERYAAVLLSGDMGPRAGLGGQLATRLADHGLATVSVNSLTYFKVRRTPAEVSAMLAEAIHRAMTLGHADRVIVLGQSFGSDMVHVGLEHLPADVRRHVAMVVLTVPTRTVFLRVSPLEWLDRTPPDAPALPSAMKLDWVPVVCIHGRDEPDSLCPLLHLPRLTQIVLPGDHYLDKDADRLFAAIRGALAAHFGPGRIFAKRLTSGAEIAP